MSTQSSDKSIKSKVNLRNTYFYNYSRQINDTYFPVLPSHNFIDLSKEAEAIKRPSGENCTQFINC